ncbi:hypothetical protein ALC53_06300 [Atta colombica]|uniref:Uncharacterized protein n=1 Tax=Atta colombica TaxID=520822 RepID=A0A195BFU2_9HYME|nr:hypothetical protein ALC53_06300 [Atta colombica]
MNNNIVINARRAFDQITVMMHYEGLSVDLHCLCSHKYGYKGTTNTLISSTEAIGEDFSSESLGFSGFPIQTLPINRPLAACTNS